jgi:RimJ/RimL family protein N-acetyltransferase
MEPIYLRSEAFRHLQLRIRPIEPSDKQKLANGFERLSPESRHRRFFGQKNTLTTEELRRYTEFDGSDHFALGAFELRETGEEGDAVGVARIFRLTEDPNTAELAIAVVDDRQGLGIGRLLLQRLLTAARDRGIGRIRCYVLADNERMRKLAENVLGKAASMRREGEILIGEFVLPDTAPAKGMEGLFELLPLIASGSVAIPAIFALTTIERRLKLLERGLGVFNETLRAGAKQLPHGLVSDPQR